MKESLESIFKKIEVITDSTAIIYSIRILIIMLALLMGYIHTHKEKLESTSRTEIIGNTSDPVLKELNSLK